MNLIIAKFKIVGESPLSWCKFVDEKKDANETHDDFERRIWKKKLHVDEKGIVFIPPMALKMCLDETAQFLKMSVPGKGKSTFSNIFKCGITVMKPISLGISIDDDTRIKPNPLMMNPQGKRGPGARVMKILPIINEWGGNAEVFIQAPELTKEVFAAHLDAAGTFKGLGQFRPAVGGYCGRFKIENFKWEKINS